MFQKIWTSKVYRRARRICGYDRATVCALRAGDYLSQGPGYTGRLQGPENSDVFGNLELEYSLRYLDHFVERLNVGRPWVHFVPYVQFNYAQLFIASRLTTKPDFRLTPGVGYLGDYREMSVGAQIALNGAAPSGDRVAVLGPVEIFYDSIFPSLG
jgi:hypothetical protein